MRKIVLSACLFLVSLSAFASCDDVKAQIDGKLQAKGVQAYTLEIVPVAKAEAPSAASGAAAAEPSKGKVVGTCEGDSKQIVYTRK